MQTPTDSGITSTRHDSADSDALPYGSWPSPISAGAIVADCVTVSEPHFDRDRLYWLEARPAERGRCVVMCREAAGDARECTPAGSNVRSRVHEYGGGAYAVRDGVLVYCDLNSGRVQYRRGDDTPRPLTPALALRYADFAIDSARGCVYAVREDHRGVDQEPVNTLVRLRLDGDNADGGEIIATGHDFFAAPRLSPDGSQLAWLSWDHPDMPWDASQLWLADLDAQGGVDNVRLIAGGAGVSVCQPQWSPAGTLHYVSDQTGWWNLYRLQEATPHALWSQKAEFAAPPWVFGQSNYVCLDDQRVLCSLTEHGIWQLAVLETRPRQLDILQAPYSEYSGLCSNGRQAAMVVGTPQRPTSLIAFDIATGIDGHRTVRASTTLSIDAAYLSQAQPIRFTSRHGRQAHAMYYPPRNRDRHAPHGTQPPLIVRGHGGPTAAVSTALNLVTQFWTSRGFAVVDVNYAGSTGYGREYRARLDGAWGVADVEDCVAAAEHLVARGLADPERLAIRGSSAGGYTVLSALTFHDSFRAGVSVYGIGDLEALAHDTHKFEKYYLDRLVGPYPEQRDLYRERSPLHHAEGLNVPVLFLQGGEDKVVPPAQAEAMVAALRARGVPVGYLSFPSEGHGFRQADSLVRALEAELAFYAQVFRFTPADTLPALAIDNLTS